MTVLQHAFVCGKVFKFDLKLRLPAGIIPLFISSALGALTTIMPECNAHGVLPTWVQPSDKVVLSFFDCLLEKVARVEEVVLIRPATEGEVAYIASRLQERALAAAAGKVWSFNEQEYDKELMAAANALAEEVGSSSA